MASDYDNCPGAQSPSTRLCAASEWDRAKTPPRPPRVVYLAAALEGEVRVGERGVWTWVALNGNLRYGNPGQPGTACGTCLGSTDILPVKVLERNITVSLCGKSSKISRPQDRDTPAQSTHTPQPTQGTL